MNGQENVTVPGREAKAIFLEAVERCPPDAWSSFLDSACAGNAVLRARVERLLKAHLQAPPQTGVASIGGERTADLLIAEHPGTQIGPYKLLEQIGEGGFGVVYLAEQTEPVRREVALKIVKPGMDTREVIARFEAERQALALMDHPNIARVFDAGATESGRPYFVMELVRGVPITEYCDRCQLTTRQRLELFATVCRAVQHAHQKGIIHRDLKPNNALVAMQDGQPAPKIIDFGVAKAINQRLTENTLHTGFAQILGTPLYMSPEQAEMSPLDIDTRADIYSMGVLLYELLTGTTPFERERLSKATFDELRQIIRHEDPPRPSNRLSTLAADISTTIAEHRRTDSRRLSQQVRGDLDWIVMKALEKDRTRRYETSNAFTRDIERFLAEEPVEARPPSAAYRLRKFARRNRVELLSATLLLVAIVVGLAVSTLLIANQRDAAQAAAEEALKQREVADRQTTMARTKAAEAEKERRRAEQNFRKAREAVDRLFTKAAEDLADEPRMEQIRRELLEDALEFYQAFLKQKSNDPLIRLETAHAYARVGDIHALLGDTPKSLENRRHSLRLIQKLHEDYPADPKYRELSAKGHALLTSQLVASRRLDEAVEHERKAIEHWEKLAADFPTKPDYLKNLASWYLRHRSVWRRTTKREQEKELRHGLALLDKLETNFPNYPKDKSLRANGLIRLGGTLIGQNRFEEGEELIRKGWAVWGLKPRQFLDRPPGESLQERLSEAEKYFRWKIERAQTAHDRFPDVENNAGSLSKSLARLSHVLVGMGRLEEAEAVMGRALAICKTWAARFPADAGQRRNIAWANYNLANILFLAGKEKQAADFYRPAFEVFAQLAREFPGVPRHQNHIAFVLTTCPAPQFRDPKRAVEFAKRALQLLPESQDYWIVLGQAQYSAAQYREAIDTWEKARKYGKLSAESKLLLAMAHRRLGDRGRAGEFYDQYMNEIKDAPTGFLISVEYHYLRAEAEGLFGTAESDRPQRQNVANPRENELKQNSEEECRSGKR